MPTNQRYLKQTDWNSVRNEFKEIAPDIFEAIEQIPLDDSFRLYEVAYPYGDLILNNGGIVHLPNPNGDLVPITHRSISKQIREDLNYSNPLPLGLVCEGMFQLYIENAPYEINSPYFFGKNSMLAGRAILDGSENFQPQHYWKGSSGCRTPILLPSIANTQSYGRLKIQYGLHGKKPDSHALQWDFFRELANSAEFKTPWVTKIIFFSKAWVPEKNALHLKPLRQAQFERSWISSRYERWLLMNNIIWNHFSSGLRHKRVREYHKLFARHVLECAFGQALSYQLYTFDNIAGPFNEIIDIIVNQYGLPNRAPLIMIPGYYQAQPDEEAFIPMISPSNNLKKDRHGKNDSIMSDQHLVKFILDEFKKKMIRKELFLNGTPLENLKHIHFDFYNMNFDKYNEIKINNEIIKPSVLKKLFPNYPNNQDLCLTNEFIRACIKLSV